MIKLDMNCCPTCESKLDGATAIDGEQTMPEPGDITVCVYCTEVLEFTTTMEFIKTDLTKLSYNMQAGLVQMIDSIKDVRPRFH